MHYASISILCIIYKTSYVTGFILLLTETSAILTYIINHFERVISVCAEKKM